MRKFVLLGAALACVLLSACQTPYARKIPGLTNQGYSEIQIDENTYQVRFDGNGNTPKEKVSLYWLYRCAELTKEKGFELFALAFPPTKKTGALELPPEIRPAAWRPRDGAPRLVPAYYVYVPGGTITTWHSRAVMRVYHMELPPDVPYALRAQAILDALHPYVESGGSEPAPTREALVKLALVKNPNYAGPAAGEAPGTEPAQPATPAAPPPPAPDEKLQPGQKAF